MKFSDKLVSMTIQFCGSWTRKALLLACLIISAVHLKVCVCVSPSVFFPNNAVFHVLIIM
jgi:hypothetical protein